MNKKKKFKYKEYVETDIIHELDEVPISDDRQSEFKQDVGDDYFD